MPIEACRSSGSTDLREFLDLGVTPLADALLRQEDLTKPEPRFPLRLAFCPESALVQITEDVPAQTMFVDNYLYFSSFSDELLEHSRSHAEALIEERHLDSSSFVVEIGSNDGYLLRNFCDAGVSALGIDPAPDQAAAATAAGVPNMAEFFGRELAVRLVQRGPRADVIIANNVFAHIPDINDFTAGMKLLLADDGVIHIENPNVQDLIERCAFDTVYHEHFYYHSCMSIDRHMRRHGLLLNDVEYFPDLHGGTLRWHIGHHHEPTPRLLDRLASEEAAGLGSFAYYAQFGRRVSSLIRDLRELLIDLRSSGARIAGYGAAAKGATLLNTADLDTDLIEYVVDRNTYKQGLFMPGTHQPIRDVSSLVTDKPDFVLLLAWNFRDEIIAQQRDYATGGGQFILPVPQPKIIGRN